MGSEKVIPRIFDRFIDLVALVLAIMMIINLLGWYRPHQFNFLIYVLMSVLVLHFLPQISKYLKEKRYNVVIWNILIFCFGISACAYILINAVRIEIWYGTVWNTKDIIFGTLLVITVLEMSRQKFGWPLVLTAVAVMLYVLFGNLLPRQFFGHEGFSYSRFISSLMGVEGILGVIWRTFARVIFIFIMFSTILSHVGVGEYLLDFSYAIAGRTRGGPAKVAVVASAFFGSISGSSVANVVSTGSVTIPLMKKVGYDPTFAGATEAAASCGGLILPPVMGSAAFIMAEFLGITYFDVAKAAVIPALLYFLGVFVMVDLEAIKQNLVGTTDVPKISTVIKGWYNFIPIIVIIVAVISRLPITRVGIYGCLACVITSWFSKDHKLGIKGIINALKDASKATVLVASSCLVAGIIINSMGVTGLGLRFGSMLVDLVGENLMAVCVSIAAVVIVLGMGMPAAPAYIIGSAIAAPALVELGVIPIAAHLFAFYFSINSTITPPVGTTFYTAAALAGSPPVKTGVRAVSLGVGAFIIPFYFVNNTKLLIMGEPIQIIIAIIMAVIAMIGFSFAIQGITFFSTKKLNIFQRILFVVSSLLLLAPSINYNCYGLGCFALNLLLAYISRAQK